MSTYAIKADKFFLPADPQLGGYLMVEDGVFGAWQADEPSCEIRDYTGSWIAPGMVDTHIHGFYNHSTTDSVEQIKDACAAIARADEGRGARRRVDTVFLGAKGLSTSFIPQRRVNGF